jgi:hypothetical protein
MDKPTEKWFIDHALHEWARWCRCSVGRELGFKRRTMEGRLRDGELPGINGSGVKCSPSNVLAESVEAAVVELAQRDEMMAFIFRQYHVRRYSYRKISAIMKRKMGLHKSHTTISKIEKEALRVVIEAVL